MSVTSWILGTLSECVCVRTCTCKSKSFWLSHYVIQFVVCTGPVLVLAGFLLFHAGLYCQYLIESVLTGLSWDFFNILVQSPTGIDWHQVYLVQNEI